MLLMSEERGAREQGSSYMPILPKRTFPSVHMITIHLARERELRESHGFTFEILLTPDAAAVPAQPSMQDALSRREAK
jgi:hypothetical protein